MYKIYGKFMKYFSPTDKREGVKYPSIWIHFREIGNEINKCIEGGMEENKENVEKFILEISKKPKKSFSLRILFFKEKGEIITIHESGEL